MSQIKRLLFCMYSMSVTEAATVWEYKSRKCNKVQKQILMYESVYSALPPTHPHNIQAMYSRFTFTDIRRPAQLSASLEPNRITEIFTWTRSRWHNLLLLVAFQRWFWNSSCSERWCYFEMAAECKQRIMKPVTKQRRQVTSRERCLI